MMGELTVLPRPTIFKRPTSTWRKGEGRRGKEGERKGNGRIGEGKGREGLAPNWGVWIRRCKVVNRHADRSYKSVLHTGSLLC